MSIQFVDSAVAQKTPPFFSTSATEYPNHSNSGIVKREGRSVSTAKAGTNEHASVFLLDGYVNHGVRARGTLVFAVQQNGEYSVVELVGANISTSDRSITDAIDAVIEEAADLVFMAGQCETSAAIRSEVEVIKRLFDFNGRA